MRIMVLKKRQDHDTSFPIAAAIGTVLMLAAAPSLSVSAQGAVPCTAIEDAAERLACYDGALRGTPAAPVPAAQAPVDSAAPTAAPGDQPPRQPRQVRESTAPAAPPAAAAPAATRNDGDQIIPIVIVGTRAHPGRETTFILADGTSWVQNDSRRINGLPDTPFEAELKPGAMGSYFLHPKDHARAIRVRPVR